MYGLPTWRSINLVYIFLIAVVFGFAPSANAVYIQHDQAVDDYKQIAALDTFGPAGYVVSWDFLGGGLIQRFDCGGTLISSNQVLTAAHCVSGRDRAQMAYGSRLDIPVLSLANVADIVIHPEYDPSVDDYQIYDLAILTLFDSFTGNLPILYPGTVTGQVATMIGYGRQGNGDVGETNISANQDRLGMVNIIDLSTADLISMDFDHPPAFPLAPFAPEGGACFGDSGSGLWTNVGRLVGIASTISVEDPLCTYGTTMFFAPIKNSKNIAFLRSNGINIPVPSGLMLFVLGIPLLVVFRRRQLCV